ncbi:MAG: hypothetical protein ACKO37_01260 [Vampirovibrionales bacterium]
MEDLKGYGMTLLSRTQLNCFGTPHTRSHGHQRSGQAAVLAIFVLTLTVLMFAAQMVAGIQRQVAMQTTFRQTNDFSLTIALQGVQEALASRMFPRSNQLNFLEFTNNPGNTQGSGRKIYNNGKLVGQFPFFPESGFVYDNLDGQNPKKKLLGAYHYMVLGGDSAQNRLATADNNGGTTMQRYLTSYKDLLNNVSYVPKTVPFYIVSRSLHCTDANSGRVVPGALNETMLKKLTADTLSKIRSRHGSLCSNMANTRLESKIVVLAVNLDQSDTSINARDYAEGMLVFNDDFFKLPNNWYGFVPNVGWTNGKNSNSDKGIDFNTAYSQTSSSNSYKLAPSRLMRVIFYDAGLKSSDPLNAIVYDIDMSNVTPGTQVTLNGNTATGGAKVIRNNVSWTSGMPAIPPYSMVKLFFQGPIDFRSISNYDPARCDQAANQCNIMVIDRGAGGTVLNANIAPMLPSSAHFLVGTGFIPGNGTPRLHELYVRSSAIRDYSGSTMAGQKGLNVVTGSESDGRAYRIMFRVE